MRNIMENCDKEIGVKVKYNGVRATAVKDD